jgi:dihydroorotase
MTRRRLIKTPRLIDPASRCDGPGALLIDAATGAILEVAAKIDAKADETIETGHAIIPGLIDLRVVTGEPGAEHKETFKSAGRAALAGGVTTFVVQPNTHPVLDDASLVDFVIRRAGARTKARVLAAAALTKGLEGKAMTEIGLLSEAGAVYFTNSDRPLTDGRLMRRALSYAGGFGALLAHRPVDPTLAGTGVMHEGEFAGRLGLPGIPATAELVMAQRDIALAELTGGRLLLDQISAALTLAPIAAAKARGVKIFASVSAHHLTLNENDIGDYRTFAKLDPPLRSEDDRKALVRGLSEGVIDVIVSAHDPQPAEEKRLPFDEAAFGAVGLETLLAVALKLHHDGEADLIDILAAMTVKPADLLGLPQGRLAPGAPADFALVDLDAPFKLDSETLFSKSKNSPFDERLLQGKIIETWVGGERVFAS